MKFEFEINEFPAGYAADFYPAGTKDAQFISGGIHTDADGELFFRMLEGVRSMYLSKVPKGKEVLENQVSFLLAIVTPKKKVQVFINEPKLVGNVLAKRAVEKGQPVTVGDMADISSLVVEGVTVPEDAGFMVVLTSGWRRGLVFDYWPLLPENKGKRRDFVFEKALGRLWASLIFQDRLSFNDEHWETFFKQKWYPFSSLSTDLVRLMKSYAEKKMAIDECLDKIGDETKERCTHILKSLMGHSFLQKHQGIVRKAIEHYQNGDFLSCSAILYPRIEGVLRSKHRKIGNMKSMKTKHLSESAVTNDKGQLTESALMFPLKFREYLDKVYFMGFDSDKEIVDVARHSVSHGETPSELLDKKAATIAVLMVEQILFLTSMGLDIEVKSKL